jgi:glycosyltransferase involved in cell wall biosynthesis
MPAPSSLLPESSPTAPTGLLSLAVLCRNESEHIADCLVSILKFERPPGYGIEVLVIDGMSDDGTRDIVTRLALEHPEIRLLDNPRKITPCAFNTAIAHSRGDYILIFSSHAQYSATYLTESIETAHRTRAANVGGVFITLQNGTTYGASLVQALTTHKFGVGSSFRTDMTEGPADTVSYGCYQRQIFDRLGRFDERLIRAQDYEYNRRIAHAGGLIWKNPRIQVFYYNQKSIAAFLRKQLRLEAPFNAYMWYLAPYAFAPRHAITGVFAAGFLGGLLLSPFYSWIAWPFLAVMGLYSLLAILSAIQQAFRFRQPLHALCLPLCFFLYHFIHGLGLLSGLVQLTFGRAPVQQAPEPWPGAGRKRAWPVPGS